MIPAIRLPRYAMIVCGADPAITSAPRRQPADIADGHLSDVIGDIRFTAPAMTELAAALRPWVRRIVQARAVIWGGAGYTIATAAQMEWSNRARDEGRECPFTIQRQWVVFHADGVPECVLVWPNGLQFGQESSPSGLLHRLDESIRLHAQSVADRGGVEAVEAEFGRRLAAKDRAAKVGRIKSTIRSQRHVLRCYRTLPYWQQAPDLADRIAEEQERLTAAERDLAAIA